MTNVAKMLIVDDELRMTDSAKAALSGQGFDIETSNSSTEALNRLRTAEFDVALLDVRMPDLTGYQLMDELDREKVQTEFIIMTGDISLDSAIEALRRGATDYVRKPFDPDELLVRVGNAIKQKKLKDERHQIEAEKLTLERQLRQSQKMEAIGTLAGGIAHDFNNILSIILGNTELATAFVPEGTEVRESLDKILQASHRAREMVKQLLSFTRKTDAERQPIELKAIIAESLNLLRASLPTNIEIQQDIPSDSLVVQGDSTQIHQIMINLCTNAAHALEGNGGVMGVKMESTTLDFATAESLALAPGPYVKLTVSDSGPGIDPIIRGRIFDPYFTTKGPGKGTGMGLAVVHGIVKNHGGAIDLFSEPDVKTEFRIFLPLADSASTQQSAEAKTALPTGLERILLVDDEEMVVDTVKKMVSTLGYHVDAATDSRAALDMFKQDPHQYDLVVTDMTMPHLTGKQLAEEMRALRADIPVILCSGFNENIDQSEASALGVSEFVKKPLSMKSLAETIRKILDRRPGERRRFQRFRAEEGAFVISKPDPSTKGTLLDISLSGLSFRYVDPETKLGYIIEVTIRAADDSCSVDGLTCETVAETIAEGGTDTQELLPKRRGMQFQELTPHQQEQLSHFIQNHTSSTFH